MSGKQWQRLPPLQELTPDNHGPAIVVASLLFVILAVLTVFIRLYTRFRMARKFVLDDFLITVAIVLSIAQTAALIVACNHGLGRKTEQVTMASMRVLNKASYTADILAILTLAFTKMSVACLIIGLNPPKATLHACNVVLTVVVLWAISGVFATAFRCDLPSPWDVNAKCLNVFAISIYDCTMNVVTDVALIAIPAHLMMSVQVSAYKRWLVSSLFASRLIVIVFSIVAIVSRQAAFVGATAANFTWELIASTIWIELMIALSIMTACLPSIRRFLSDLKTGLMGVSISEPLEQTLKNVSSRATATEGRRKSSYGFGSRIASSLGIKSQRSNESQAHADDEMYETRKFASREQFNRSRNVLSRTVVEHSESRKDLTQNVIMQTIDYGVEYQSNEDHVADEAWTQREAHAGPSNRPANTWSDRQWPPAR